MSRGSENKQTKFEKLPSRAAIGAALSIGTIALLILGIQPILLGALLEAHTATLKGVGVIAMSEIVALGAGVVIGNTLFPLSALRIIGITSAVFVALLDAATVFMSGDAHLTIVRSAAGLGEGGLLWLTTCIIVRSSSPDRLTGIFLAAQTLAQAVLAAAYAGLVIPSGGWQAGYIVLGAITLLACVAVIWLPAGVAPLRSRASSALKWTLAEALPPGIVLLQMAAIGALWAYLEPLGKRAGFGSEGAQAITAVALLMQVLGGTSASFAVKRLDAVRVLAVGTVLLGAIPFAIHRLPPGSTLSFSSLCAAFGFVWLFLMPFQVSLAFRVDPAGRVAMLIPAMQLLGTALGPISASLLVREGDAGSVPLVSLAFALAAAALLALGRSRFRAGPAKVGAILQVGPSS